MQITSPALQRLPEDVLKSIKDNTVVDLDLPGCSLDDDDIIELAQLLRMNTQLATINLTNNNFGDKGLRALIELFARNKNIREAWLWQNKITDDGAADLVAAIKAGLGVERIWLGRLNKVSTVMLTNIDNALTVAEQRRLASRGLLPTVSQTHNLLPPAQEDAGAVAVAPGNGIDAETEAKKLADNFEPGKWVGNIDGMKRAWVNVPESLKNLFNFSQALADARIKTMTLPSKKKLKKGQVKRPGDAKNS